jgi:hypothetical protein
MYIIKALLLFSFINLSLLSSAQKRVLNYPFEFEKSLLSRADFDAHFLGNATDSGFVLVLKDNKKAEYLLLDKKFKTTARISSALPATVFNERIMDYAGGTNSRNQFHFIYAGKDHYLETVDFTTKTISHKKLFEDTREEKPLVSFTSNNVFYALTTNDKSGELSFYIVNEQGLMQKKSVRLPIPADAGKKNDKVSEYLYGIRVFKADEQPDLSSAVHNAKLFAFNDRLELLINNEGAPTHIIRLTLPDMNVSEKFIDYKDIIPANEKKKWYVSSFQKDGKLFSLLLNKKEIQLAVHDLAAQGLLKKYTLTEDSGTELLAQQPLSERRLGKKTDEKDLDIKKLIKALSKGTEGLMVTKNKAGQLILTFGTYDLIPLSSGGSSGGWQGGWQQSSMPVQPSITNHGATRTAVSVWNPTMYYRPGSPSYTTTSARYYNTSYCKMLLDPETLKVARGRLPIPEADQIKDYIEGISSKAKATNQFSIGSEQYYGYYDKDAKAYVIDHIRIIQ